MSIGKSKDQPRFLGIKIGTTYSSIPIQLLPTHSHPYYQQYL